MKVRRYRGREGRREVGREEGREGERDEGERGGLEGSEKRGRYEKKSVRGGETWKEREK